jgi:autotransporter-associated beta strand protein
MRASSITFEAKAGGTLIANALATTSNADGSIFGNFEATADAAGSLLQMNGLTTMHLNGASNLVKATNGGTVELTGLSTVTHTANMFERLDIQSTGSGSLVNLRSLRSTTGFPDAITLSSDGELDLGGIGSPFAVSFSASFSSANGTLDVYDGFNLLASIAPGTLSTFNQYFFNVSSPGGTQTIRFVAANGASISMRDYAIVSLQSWSGGASGVWSTSPSDANWPGATPWTNSPDRNAPNAATFNVVPTGPITVNGNIDVSSITFTTGDWTLNAGAGRLAYGANGNINVNTLAGINTIHALIANGSTFGTGGGTTSLTKNGPGTLVLSNANTYTGTTTVNQGVLRVTNTTGSAVGTGNVTLNGGTLAGSGKITGTVLGGTGPHTVAPSTTLTLGKLTTNANTILAFNLTTPTAASPDRLVITSGNGLTLNGGTIVLPTVGSGPGSLGYYKIIQYTGFVIGSGINSITLPAAEGDIVYSLDTKRDAGFVDLHRGYLGDANDDGAVTFTDYIALANNFGLLSKGWSGGDFNNDGSTSFTDFIILANNFGEQVGGGSLAVTSDEIAAFHAAAESFFASTSIPEPGTLPLVALAGAALLRRTKKSRA